MFRPEGCIHIIYGHIHIELFSSLFWCRDYYQAHPCHPSLPLTNMTQKCKARAHMVTWSGLKHMWMLEKKHDLNSMDLEAHL